MTTSMCNICGKPAKHVCTLCGQHVCDDHFDAVHHICTTCKGGRRFRGKTA